MMGNKVGVIVISKLLEIRFISSPFFNLLVSLEEIDIWVTSFILCENRMNAPQNLHGNTTITVKSIHVHLNSL